MAKATDPLASGGSTSEGKLSIFSAVAGVAVAMLAVLEPLFQKAADENPNNFWLRLAVAVAGLAVTATSTWTFTKSRTVVKGSILDVIQQGAVALAPMVATVVLKKYLVPPIEAQLPQSMPPDNPSALKQVESSRVPPLPKPNP